MKKLIISLLSLILVLTFAACASEEVDNGKTTGDPVDDTGLVGVANPMVELTKEEFEENTKLQAFTPEGATEVVYFKINGETGIFEINYLYKGAEFTFRYAVGEEQDISGLYYTWDKNEDLETFLICHNQEENVGFASWYKDGANYCLTASCVSYELLKETAAQCYDFYKN